MKAAILVKPLRPVSLAVCRGPTRSKTFTNSAFKDSSSMAVANFAGSCTSPSRFVQIHSPNNVETTNQRGRITKTHFTALLFFPISGSLTPFPPPSHAVAQEGSKPIHPELYDEPSMLTV
jgi:hypothetical protein